ncbi:MAG: hypothetical protein GF330_12305, partial [Candidatus Eisenbacteria bacterium]|nr:hypothetical protein [Candidatus Eisenbacteria bacterium]
AAVGATIEQVRGGLGEVGFPLAQIELEGFRQAPQDCLLLELGLRRGPPVRVAGVRFTGDARTRRSHLLRLVGWEGDEPYRASRWQAAREHLLATGLFASVSEPRLLLPESPAGDGPEEGANVAPATVQFDLQGQAVSHFEGVLGYSGERATLAGFLDLALGNLFGTGRAMRLFWQRYERESSRFEFAWHEPYLWRLPVELDLELSHETEDTLYARTRYGAALRWRPVRRWSAAVSASRDRTVLSAPVSGRLRRAGVAFEIARQVPQPEQWRVGWSVRLQFERITGSAPRVRRFDLEAREWRRFGSWGLWVEQRLGLLGGEKRFLRSDIYRIGGSRATRGYYDGELRAVRYLLQRAELGPRLGMPGARLYLLADVCWLEEWSAAVDGIYGAAGEARLVWSYGAGLRMPSRAGAIRLDYAVPRGGSLGAGRLHFGLESRF